MLPETLLCLLSATLALAQIRQELPLNAVSSFNSLNLPNPPAFTLPTAEKLTITVALCSGGTTPQFFVTNSSSFVNGVDDPGSDGGTDVFEIQVNEGHGNWTGVFNGGGVLALEGIGAGGQFSFEVGVSNGGMCFHIDHFPGVDYGVV